MYHHVALSLTIPALIFCGISEGYPHALRYKRSGETEYTMEASANQEDNSKDRGISPLAQPAGDDTDEVPTGMMDPRAQVPSDDGLLPSIGGKKPGEGGGGLFPQLPSFPPLGGGSGGGGSGFVGPMAVLGGFSALIMPMGGPLLNNLPGALSSLTGMMQNIGSLPSLPALGGSSG